MFNYYLLIRQASCVSSIEYIRPTVAILRFFMDRSFLFKVIGDDINLNKKLVCLFFNTLLLLLSLLEMWTVNMLQITWRTCELHQEASLKLVFSKKGDIHRWIFASDGGFGTSNPLQVDFYHKLWHCFVDLGHPQKYLRFAPISFLL